MARSRRSKDAPSEFFPGFTDVDEIGSGSVATVYRAQAHGTGRQVALKVISRDVDPALVAAAEQELANLGPLTSDTAIVSVFRHFRAEDGRLVLVLDLCQGSLRDRISDGRPMPVADVLAAGVTVARALHTAHQARVLHRDVTPGNILLTGAGRPALGDFALAGLRRLGTPSLDGALHVAPELLTGRGPTPAGDVYGLASSLYQLIAGRPAFGVRPGEPVDAGVQRLLRETPPPLRNAPAPVADLLARALAKDPAARPAGAAAFGDELVAVARHDSSARSYRSLRDGMPPQPPPAPKADVDWSSPTLSQPEAPAAPVTPLAPAAPAAPEPQPAPPAVEQTVRRSDLPAAFTPAPEPPAPEPVPEPPASEPPAPAPAPPPVEQTVRRSMLPPEFWATSTPPPETPAPDATVARGSLRGVPEARSRQSPPPQPPPPADVEETVFRAGRPQLPPPTQAPDTTVMRSSLPQQPPRPPGFAGPIALDPSALARRVTLRSGRSAMVVDETGLTLRALLRKKHIAWNDLSGFETRYDDPANPMTGGHLVAITREGPVDLPATKREMADLRYTQALLEAYRLRAQAASGR